MTTATLLRNGNSYTVQVDDINRAGYAWVTAPTALFDYPSSGKHPGRVLSNFGQVELDELIFDDCTCNGENNPTGCPACTEQLRRQYDVIPF